MASKTAARLNLKQCLDIKENYYRSKDNLTDYQSEEVDARIFELQNSHARRRVDSLVKLYEEGITAMFDWAFEENNEYWTLSPSEGSEKILIPPRICPF